MHINKLDIINAQRIHRKYYQNEFSLPDFANFDNTFQLSLDNNEPVIVGGYKLTPELVFLTDKDISVLDRRTALLTALDYVIYTCQVNQRDSIHVFTKDDRWANRLRRIGFLPIEGQGLILHI